jgi:hypothetical protein
MTVKEYEVGGGCSTQGSDEQCLQNFVGKPEGKRQLEESKQRSEDNIKVDCKETACEVVAWIRLGTDLVQWRAVVDTVMKLGRDIRAVFVSGHTRTLFMRILRWSSGI